MTTPQKPHCAACGGERHVSGYCNRLKPGELVAWMDGFTRGFEAHRARTCEPSPEILSINNGETP